MLGAALSTTADPIPWARRVICTRNPALGLPFLPSGRTAMHRALCAALVQQQPLGLTFLEWCPEEMEQSAPSLSASALACSARKDGVPLDTPHRHVGWMKDQQHHIAAKGEPIWGNLQTLQRGTKKPPSVLILLLLPTAHHSGQPGHSTRGWGPPLTTSPLLQQGPHLPPRPLSPPRAAAPSLCLGDSSDFTVTVAVWPEQREVSNVQSRDIPTDEKATPGKLGETLRSCFGQGGIGAQHSSLPALGKHKPRRSRALA